MKINEIKDDQGMVWQKTEDIGNAAVQAFMRQFTIEGRTDDFSILEVIPKLISDDQNLHMKRPPTIEEAKDVVFGMSKESFSGSDGFSGAFFQACWAIIKEDILRMVMTVFCARELSKFVTHTNMVLIPKKEKITTFNYLRPISLSTFVNKIISKVLHGRISRVLSDIISKNQTGFMKRRSIAENVLLAQELIKDIKKKKDFHNIVVKLDMAKTYDRVL